ncbi:MAG: c-type cytochrome [Elusimicrobia bacterium]|nr:c-type cytochrome [Elusimicrobiota bacterium]
MTKGILIGVLGTLAALAAAGYFAAASGRLPAHADAKPPRWEKWIARKALKSAIWRGAPKGPNPVAETDENLVEGIQLYAVDCAVCHGASDGTASHIAQGLYQKAPQFAKYGVEDWEDGEIFWTIQHGIRMTGMPAFREALSETELWKIALFLKNMSSLTEKPQKVWKSVPSAGFRRVHP